MRLTLRLAASGAALGLLLAGCQGKPAGQPSAQASAAPSVSACPAAPSTSPEWPADLPADLPKPTGARIEKVERTKGNLLIVQFRTPHSLREAVTFVVREFPKRGYVIGRGDAEAIEADAPFERGPLRGLARMFLVKDCETLWVYATGQEGAGVPFNPSFSPGPSASQLPFG